MGEWLSFHWLVGLDGFIAMDDNSTDNMLEVLQQYKEAGILDDFRVRTTEKRTKQYKPVVECMEQYDRMRQTGMGYMDAVPIVPQLASTHGNRTRPLPKWITTHDQDEFLFPMDKPGILLADTLAQFNASCVQVRRYVAP